MKFTIRNQANISNKYIRFAKWKIRKLSRKFYQVLYSDVYIKEVSSSPKLYEVVVRMGVPGPDLIVRAKSGDLNELWAKISAKVDRQLRKYVKTNR